MNHRAFDRIDAIVRYQMWNLPNFTTPESCAAAAKPGAAAA
jgi:hypothetical protein